MSIRDILVYADPSPASGERLDLAFRLAHRFEAYLIGVVPEDAAAVGDRFATMLRQPFRTTGRWRSGLLRPGSRAGPGLPISSFSGSASRITRPDWMRPKMSSSPAAGRC